MGALSNTINLFTNFRSVFVEPWGNKKRSKVLLAGALGAFGSCMLGLVLSYNIAGQSLFNNLAYQVLTMGLTGLVGIGLSFWLMSFPKRRLWIFLMEATGVAIFSFAPQSPMACALANCLVTSPFAAAFNGQFALEQSIKNNAREVTLSGTVTLLLGSLGTWLGGLFLQKGFYVFPVCAGLLFLTLATHLLIMPFDTRQVFKKSLALPRKKKFSSHMTFYAASLSAVEDFSLPIWFRAMNISAFSTGTILALQSILAFLFSPLIGNLVQKGTLRAIRIGGAFSFCIWAVMFFEADQIWLLPFILSLITVKNKMTWATEASRWFKLKSPSGVTAREMILAAGRVPSFFVAIPMIFAAPALFPLYPLGLSCLFIFGLRKRKNKM